MTDPGGVAAASLDPTSSEALRPQPDAVDVARYGAVAP
jgi:hypothetical protein